jgi:hypothetical protein
MCQATTGPVELARASSSFSHTSIIGRAEIPNIPLGASQFLLRTYRSAKAVSGSR